jgi:sugar phosphate isomerase/epimerase
MKLACQETLVPGSNLLDKADLIADIGFEAVELVGGRDIKTLKARTEEVQRALDGHTVEVSSLCGVSEPNYLAPDVDVRKKAVADYKEALKIAGELGCVGPIFVPVFGPPKIESPWPLESAEELEKEILCAIISELAPVAAEHGTNIVLEPLNRYETHLVNSLQDAVEIMDLSGNPDGLKIMADFFHMNIEEPDIAASIRDAGHRICHVHLADSNRLEPGAGHTDFESGLRALKDIGYDGYLALECGLSDYVALDAELSGPDAEGVLRESVAYLKDIIDRL